MVPMSTIYVAFLATLLVFVPETAEAYYNKTLTEGERISNGQYLMVPDNSTLVPPWLAMQQDCNFVLYDQFGQPAWSTGTYGQGLAGSCYATVTDCYLLVYGGTSQGVVLWNSTTSNSSGAEPCYATILLPVTNLTAPPAALLYDSTGSTVWSSQ